MGSYSIKYDKDRKLLFLEADGTFTAQQAVEYLRDISIYLDKEPDNTISFLVDLRKLKPYPPDAAKKFDESRKVFAVRMKKVAYLVDSAISKVYSEKLAKDYPNIKVFRSKEEACSYLGI